jgi:hypothetical protein
LQLDYNSPGLRVEHQKNRWQGTIPLIARGGDLDEDRLEFGEIVTCHDLLIPNDSHAGRCYSVPIRKKRIVLRSEVSGRILRLTIIILVILVFLAWGAYRLYQNPRVQELFHDPEPKSLSNPILPGETERVREKPAAVRKAEGVRAGIAGAVPAPKRLTAAAPPAEEQTEEPSAAQNRVANDVVSRVLLQILAAKKVADGISLVVTDNSVVVAGTVGSDEKRKQILEIIEKGRETRRIDAINLVVRQ